MNLHSETASVSYCTYKWKLGHTWNVGSVIRIQPCVSSRKLLKIYSFTEDRMFAVISYCNDAFIIEQLCSELFVYWLRDILHKQYSGRWMYYCVLLYYWLSLYWQLLFYVLFLLQSYKILFTSHVCRSLMSPFHFFSRYISSSITELS